MSDYRKVQYLPRQLIKAIPEGANLISIIGRYDSALPQGAVPKGVTVHQMDLDLPGREEQLTAEAFDKLYKFAFGEDGRLKQPLYVHCTEGIFRSYTMAVALSDVDVDRMGELDEDDLSLPVKMEGHPGAGHLDSVLIRQLYPMLSEAASRLKPPPSSE